MEKAATQGKRATYTILLKWFLTASVKDVIEFIHKEMMKNLQTLDPLSRLKFVINVMSEGKWDYKIPIQKEFNVWSLDAPRGTRYQHDIWGNLHYGYIGSAIGYSKIFLLLGGHFASLQSTLFKRAFPKFDEPKDQAAITIGINLWNSFGRNVKKDDILRKVRFFKLVLASEKAPEGQPSKTFLQKQGSNA